LFQKYLGLAQIGLPHKNLLFGKRFRILKERLFNMDVKTFHTLLMTAFHGQDKENTLNGLYH